MLLNNLQKNGKERELLIQDLLDKTYSISKAREQAKEMIMNTAFPLSFEPEKWNGLETNCYAYALNSLVGNPSSTDNTIYYPGAFSEYAWKKCYTISELKERLFSDFKALKLMVQRSNLKEAVPQNAYKLCFLSNGNSYHFFRYDKQGFWSHKPSFWFPPTNIYLGKFITNPEEAKNDYWEDFYVIDYYIISHYNG